jgi:hypothetical protein
MQHHRVARLILAVGAVSFLAATVVADLAQTAKGQFRARLSVVPLDLTMQSRIAGRGTVTATLSGTTLTIKGEFTELKTPATVARVHNGSKGIRGPALFDLEVSKATSGTISGVIELTAAQIDELKNSRFYIQLHSQKAPEGNLWGWLLPLEDRK